MGDSPVWTDLLKVKQIYLRGRQIITKKMENTPYFGKTNGYMINHSVLLHLWCLSGVRKKMQQFTSS
jgi:hypothetical protein